MMCFSDRSLTELLPHLRAEEQWAWNEFIHRTEAWLIRSASLYTKTRQDAEDVVQDALITLHKKVHGLHELNLSYLCGAVRNAATARHDYDAAQCRSVARTQQFSETHEATCSDGGDEDGVLNSIIRKEEWEGLQEALPELVQDYRELIALHDFERLSFADIGKFKNETENAVRLRWCRAYKDLKHFVQIRPALDELCPEDRNVIVLYGFKKLLFREISDLTGESEKEVQSRYDRAAKEVRMILARMLTEEE